MFRSIRIFFIVAGIVACGSAFAQYEGYVPLSDLAAFKKEFATESAKINTITSNFTQEKNLVALTEKITSNGTFKFKRSNKVRLEYVQPFYYLMIMNGEKMTLKDDAKSSTMNLKSNKLFQQINRIVVDCIQGTILDSKDFTTKVFDSKEKYLLEMTPTSKSLKGFFQTIILTVEKKDYSVHAIRMNEPSGDTTIITFTEKKLNVPVQDSAFTL